MIDLAAKSLRIGRVYGCDKHQETQLAEAVDELVREAYEAGRREHNEELAKHFESRLRVGKSIAVAIRQCTPKTPMQEVQEILKDEGITFQANWEVSAKVCNQFCSVHQKYCAQEHSANEVTVCQHDIRKDHYCRRCDADNSGRF